MRDELLRQIVLAFELVADSVVDRVDQLEHVLDVSTAPEQMLRALADAAGFPSGRHLTPDVVREAMGRMTPLRHQRRTSAFLAEAVALATGVTIAVSDPGAVTVEGGTTPRAEVVVIDIAEADGRLAGLVAAAVERELPVAVPFRIVSAGRPVWPILERDDVPSMPQACPTCGESVPPSSSTVSAEHFCVVCDEPLFWLTDSPTPAAVARRGQMPDRCSICGHQDRLPVLAELADAFCPQCDHPRFWQT
jgi:hypothetical protein